MTEKLTIACDAAPLISAIESLADFAKRSPQQVKGFIGGLNSSAQLCCVNGNSPAATAASKFGITLEPSDLLVEFLAAMRARDGDDL